MSEAADEQAPGKVTPGDDRETVRRLAHEINNAIGAILIAAQYAASVIGRSDSEPVVAKALADIEAEAGRCRDLFRELQQKSARGLSGS